MLRRKVSCLSATTNPRKGHYGFADMADQNVTSLCTHMACGQAQAGQRELRVLMTLTLSLC